MRHVAVFVVCVLVVLLYIVDEMVAIVIWIGQRVVVIIHARHQVAAIADVLEVVNEVIQVIFLNYQAIAVESRHIAHLVVLIESVISVVPLPVESGG